MDYYGLYGIPDLILGITVGVAGIYKLDSPSYIKLSYQKYRGMPGGGPKLEKWLNEKRNEIQEFALRKQPWSGEEIKEFNDRNDEINYAYQESRHRKQEFIEELKLMYQPAPNIGSMDKKLLEKFINVKFQELKTLANAMEDSPSQGEIKEFQIRNKELIQAQARLVELQGNVFGLAVKKATASMNGLGKALGGVGNTIGHIFAKQEFQKTGIFPEGTSEQTKTDILSEVGSLTPFEKEPKKAKIVKPPGKRKFGLG